jgi:hypothetical protein
VRACVRVSECARARVCVCEIVCECVDTQARVRDRDGLDLSKAQPPNRLPPQAYSSAFPGDTGGPSYVGPAKDQGGEEGQASAGSRGAAKVPCEVVAWRVWGTTAAVEAAFPDNELQAKRAHTLDLPLICSSTLAPLLPAQ